MKPFDWNSDKNEQLKAERDLGFEDILAAIEEEGLLASIEHPNQKKYPNQQILLVCMEEYIYMVPFVEDEEKIFLKTIIPSRKLTKLYLQSKSHKKPS
jgi:hypothetical protein